MTSIFPFTRYSASDTRKLVAGILDETPSITKVLASQQSPHVVVKPNWVQESHEDLPDAWEHVITHPTVVVGVIEALCARMTDGGTVVVCDAPHTYASFDAIVARGGFEWEISRLAKEFPRVRFSLLDLRTQIWTRRNGVILSRRPNAGDPARYVDFDLGRDSLLYRHTGEGRYYGADYDAAITNSHHCGTVHEYRIARTPIACDLFVNIPKLKTHKKTGITCALKNLVGINADKNWLPHHTEGTPENGGDERPSAGFRERLEARTKMQAQRLLRIAPRLGASLYARARTAGMRAFGDSATTIRNGNWSGNDTCWRMALDLNRCLLFGNPDGSLRDRTAPKHYLAIVDGIIGGEGDGPLRPDPVRAGVLLAGTDPSEVDAVAARLMGFDPSVIPIIARSFDRHRWPLADCPMRDAQVHDTRSGRTVALTDVPPAVPGGFRPHFGWRSLAISAD